MAIVTILAIETNMAKNIEEAFIIDIQPKRFVQLLIEKDRCLLGDLDGLRNPLALTSSIA